MHQLPDTIPGSQYIQGIQLNPFLYQKIIFLSDSIAVERSAWFRFPVGPVQRQCCAQRSSRLNYTCRYCFSHCRWAGNRAAKIHLPLETFKSMTIFLSVPLHLQTDSIDSFQPIGQFEFIASNIYYESISRGYPITLLGFCIRN